MGLHEASLTDKAALRPLSFPMLHATAPAELPRLPTMG